MRWDFGRVYKEIRKSKGLSQKQVCGTTIARTTLSRIENNKEIPSVEIMDFLLKQINIDFFEFDYICRNGQVDDKETIINLFEAYFACTSPDYLADILNHCQHYLKFQEDILIKEIENWVKDELLRQNESKPSDTFLLSKSIWARLEKQDNWSLIDLHLLNLILFHFPIESLPYLSQHLLDTLKDYENFPPSRSLAAKILNRLSLCYFYYYDLKNAQHYGQLALKAAKTSQRIDHIGWTKVLLGTYVNDEALIEEGRQLLLLGESQSVEWEIERLKNWKKSHSRALTREENQNTYNNQ